MILSHLSCFTWFFLLYGSINFFLVQRVCGTLMNSCLLEYATVFPIKNKFQPVILTFYFGLVPQFYFLKWNRFFSTFIPVLCEHITTLTTYYHGKCVLIYKLKNFRSWNFDTKLECTGVLVSKVTMLESIH